MRELLEIVRRLAEFPQVRAVALAGSRGAGEADALSDTDLYVYAETEVEPAARRVMAAAFADRFEIDNRFWEPGDEWIDRVSGSGIDIMYRSPSWIEDRLARLLDRHEASVGYSTCFWWNVLHSEPLYDPEGWYARLQESARRPYPADLRRAIIAKNLPLLRRNISSYRRQLESAIARGDRISVNHRVAAFLASYWDVIFALNEIPHPGEKRIAEYARRLCRSLPRDWERDLDALLAAPTVAVIDALAEGLEKLAGETL